MLPGPQVVGRITKRFGPIVLHYNARLHTSNETENCLSSFNFDVLPHPPFCPDKGPTDYSILCSTSWLIKCLMIWRRSKLALSLNSIGKNFGISLFLSKMCSYLVSVLFCTKLETLKKHSLGLSANSFAVSFFRNVLKFEVRVTLPSRSKKSIITAD